MPTTVWEKHQVERKKESKKEKISDYSRGRENCKIGCG